MPTTRRPSRNDELPTLETADLTRVTGGAGDDMSSAMMMALAMRNRGQAAAAAPAPAVSAIPPWQPQITVDGVPQQLTSTGDGTYSTSTSA
ncbi:MAG TPA: hypothetical protein VHT91_16885 [Kofleriaceae bacterium]|jgi:hypothetical protein|nr:hypothetical protein [Kofleriaceae bacterium]